MLVNVDVNNVKDFVYSDTFREFLLSNTTEFGTAAFVLQTLMDRIEEIEMAEEDAE